MNLDTSGIANSVIAMLIFVAINSALRYGWIRLRAHASKRAALSTTAMKTNMRKDWASTLGGTLAAWYCLSQVQAFSHGQGAVTRQDIASVAMWASFFTAFFLYTLFRPADQ